MKGQGRGSNLTQEDRKRGGQHSHQRSNRSQSMSGQGDSYGNSPEHAMTGKMGAQK